jgi:predicted nucleic-acid-binding protein
MGIEMVFTDTNLFLRYLTNDVPAQADLVEALLRRAAKGLVTLVTTSLVIAEIVWTLESYYQLSKKDIQAKVLAILNTTGLDVVDSDLVLQAIGTYVEKNVDFIDAYNVAWMLKNNVGTVYTFDQKHFSWFEGIVTEVP